MDVNNLETLLPYAAPVLGGVVAGIIGWAGLHGIINRKDELGREPLEQTKTERAWLPGFPWLLIAPAILGFGAKIAADTIVPNSNSEVNFWLSEAASYVVAVVGTMIAERNS